MPAPAKGSREAPDPPLQGTQLTVGHCLAVRSRGQRTGTLGSGPLSSCGWMPLKPGGSQSARLQRLQNPSHETAPEPRKRPFPGRPNPTFRPSAGVPLSSPHETGEIPLFISVSLLLHPSFPPFLVSFWLRGNLVLGHGHVYTFSASC